MGESESRELIEITVTENGPYIVKGDVEVRYVVMAVDSAGKNWEWKLGESVPVTPRFALCRCGNSSNKPFCDGSHRTHGFEGTPTAELRPYEEQAQIFDGPTMQLGDAESLCGHASFCAARGGAWNLIAQTGNQEAREALAHIATHCPSGRLVAYDKESLGAPVRNNGQPMIGIVERPARGVSGGLVLFNPGPDSAFTLRIVKGHTITSHDPDGVNDPSHHPHQRHDDMDEYTPSGNLVLCRCGHSANKPLCDGSHTKARFADPMLNEVTADADGSDVVLTAEV